MPELPSITISGNSIVGYGSRVSLSAIISSTVQISSVKWQKVYSNGAAYDINVVSTSGKYTGSSNSITNPVLVINGVDFTDETNYQLVVTTPLGQVTSNQINLIVTGGIHFCFFFIFLIDVDSYLRLFECGKRCTLTIYWEKWCWKLLICVKSRKL